MTLPNWALSPGTSNFDATFAGVAPITSVKTNMPLPLLTPLAASRTRSKLTLISS